VWSQEHPERIGRRAARLLVAPAHVNAVCAVSTLEIARLIAAGDIVLSMPLRDWVEQSLADLDAETLVVTHEVAIEAYAFPGKFHRDPADRIQVAAARCHGSTLVTADDRILAYPEVRTIDVRR
jgi:PIN domain nuclease of toxin-antitoxin system